MVKMDIRDKWNIDVGADFRQRSGSVPVRNRVPAPMRDAFSLASETTLLPSVSK